MATTVKSTKKWFYKDVNKRQNEEKLCHLLDMRSKIVTKDEEKAEVLNAFFPSVFSRQTSYHLCNQPPELVDRDREKNRPHAIHEEAFSDLLCHVNTHKSVGQVGFTWGSEEAGGRACQATLHHSSSVLVNQKS